MRSDGRSVWIRNVWIIAVAVGTVLAAGEACGGTLEDDYRRRSRTTVTTAPSRTGDTTASGGAGADGRAGTLTVAPVPLRGW